MLELILSIGAAILIVLLAEWLWLKDQIKGESNRKLIHIAHGLAIATWPFFVSLKAIIVVELLLTGVIALDKKLHILRGAKAISRLTWGEFWYPAGIITLALLEPPKWIFAAAVLHLALADAVAALVGTSRLGKHKYTVFGHIKSIEGSFAFFLTSVLITSGIIYLAPSGIDKAIGLPLTLFVGAISTGLENAGIYGTDNILVPAFVALALSSVV